MFKTYKLLILLVNIGLYNSTICFNVRLKFKENVFDIEVNNTDTMAEVKKKFIETQNDKLASESIKMEMDLGTSVMLLADDITGDKETVESFGIKSDDTIKVTSNIITIGVRPITGELCTINVNLNDTMLAVKQKFAKAYDEILRSSDRSGFEWLGNEKDNIKIVKKYKDGLILSDDEFGNDRTVASCGIVDGEILVAIVRASENVNKRARGCCGSFSRDCKQEVELD